MGQHGTRRRKEKLRAEQRRQEEKRAQNRTEAPGGNPKSSGAESSGSSEFASLQALVMDATANLASRDLRSYDRAIDRLALWTSTSSAVDVVSGVVLSELSRYLRASWRRGWQPADVVNVVRRMDSTAHGVVTAAAVVDDAKHDRDLPTHPLWAMQLEDLSPWWDQREETVPSWLDRVGRDVGLMRRAVLEHCVGVMARVQTFGTLPTLIPPPGPGASRAASGQSSKRVSDKLDPKMLSKVRALLAKAESTEFAEEADSLTEKAQQLMTRYSIDAAMVDASATFHDGPEGRRIHIDAPYADAKGSLLGAVASANRCRVVIDATYGFANIFGFATDLALVDVLFTSLLAQATLALVAAGRSSSQRGSTTSKSFRRSFLLAYAGRIRERLQDAAAASTKQAESDFGSSMLPVLVRRKTDVEAMVTSVFPKTTAVRRRISNEGGWIAGREAADRASLDTWGAVPAKSTS